MTSAQLPGSEFRWRFTDDVVGEHWSDWHTVDGACPSCCHGGPRDGVHQEPADKYDEYDILSADHSYLDPTDIEEWVSVEWKL